MRTNASSVCSCPLVNCFLSRQPIFLSRIYQPLSCVDLLWVPLLLLKICFIWPSVHGIFQLTQFQIHLFCCQPIFYAFMCLSNISLLHLLVLNNTVLLKWKSADNKYSFVKKKNVHKRGQWGGPTSQDTWCSSLMI